MVPTLGSFFTHLNLVEAFQEYDRFFALSRRTYVPPNFAELRHILNIAQVGTRSEHPLVSGRTRTHVNLLVCCSILDDDVAGPQHEFAGSQKLQHCLLRLIRTWAAYVPDPYFSA